MKNYNVKAIMKNAWAIYHKADDGSEIKPLFSICLKMAWANAKNSSERVINEWAAMTTEKQMQYIAASVKRASKDAIAYSIEDKYNQFNEPVAWFFRAHDLDEFVNEAWIKITDCLTLEYLNTRNAKRAESGKQNVSLSSLVYQAAVHAINKIYRSDVKHGRAEVKTIRDNNGNEYSYIDTMAHSRRDNTELQAIHAITMAEFINSRDNTDRVIIEGIKEGYKGKEIAAAVGISAPAVTKRLNKIREAAKELLA